MTQFTFPSPASPAAQAWLHAAAEYLRSASPASRRGWLNTWIPAAKEFPLTGDVTAFDKSLVIITLERWKSEISEREAA